MNTTIIAIIVFISVFSVSAFVLLRAAPDDAEKHKRRLLKNLGGQGGGDELAVRSILRGENTEGGLNQLLRALPGMETIYEMMVKTGELKPNLSSHLLRMVLTFLVLYVAFIYANFNIMILVPAVLILIFISPVPVVIVVLFICALAYLLQMKMLAFIAVMLMLTWMLPKKILIARIEKRNQQFLDVFPDAMDMIVRSVRAGHPLSASLRMIAENIDPPVSTEFKQVIDEISYGRTLAEALARMAERIDQPDLNYFVVVLSVQQETGGNLSEVLSNLSEIIRKRKMLRLKIRALTAEARATGWVLGIMPVLVFGILYWMSPGYLMPLIERPLGNAILMSAIGLVMVGAWVVQRMIQVKV